MSTYKSSKFSAAFVTFLLSALVHECVRFFLEAKESPSQGRADVTGRPPGLSWSS